MITLLGIIEIVCDFVLSVMQTVDGWQLAGLLLACLLAFHLIRHVSPIMQSVTSSRLVLWMGYTSFRLVYTFYRTATPAIFSFCRTRFALMRARRKPAVEQSPYADGAFSILPASYQLGRSDWDSLDAPAYERRGLQLNY